MKKTKIKVIGIGEYGIKTVNRFVEEGTKDIELWTMDFKEDTFKDSKSLNKLVITDNCDDKIATILKDTELLFVLADVNDDNYINALFNITKLSGENSVKKQLNLLCPLENKKQMDFLPFLHGSCSFFLSSGLESNIIAETFCVIIDAISSCLNAPGMINITLDDIQKMFNNSCFFCGIGRAFGENRAEKAVKIALEENLKQISPDAIYVNICGGEDLTLAEVTDALSYLNEGISDDTKIIISTAVDNKMGDDVQAVVILS